MEASKCLKCGAKTISQVGVFYEYACKTLVAVSTGEYEEKIDCVRRQLEQKGEELDAAKEEAADYDETYRMVMDEKCAGDEIHCTCVPHLRRGIKELREQLDAEKAKIEQHRATASGASRRLRLIEGALAAEKAKVGAVVRIWGQFKNSDFNKNSGASSIVRDMDGVLHGSAADSTNATESGASDLSAPWGFCDWYGKEDVAASDYTGMWLKKDDVERFIGPANLSAKATESGTPDDLNKLCDTCGEYVRDCRCEDLPKVGEVVAGREVIVVADTETERDPQHGRHVVGVSWVEDVYVDRHVTILVLRDKPEPADSTISETEDER